MADIIRQNFGENSKLLLDEYHVENIQSATENLFKCTFHNGNIEKDGLLKFEVVNNPLYTVLMSLCFASVHGGLPLYCYDIFEMRTNKQNRGIVLVQLFEIPIGMTLFLKKDISRNEQGLITVHNLVESVYNFLRLICKENINPNTMKLRAYAFLYNDNDSALSMVLLHSSNAQNSTQCSQENLTELEKNFSTRLSPTAYSHFKKMMKNVSSTIKAQDIYQPDLKFKTDQVDLFFDNIPKPRQPIHYESE